MLLVAKALHNIVMDDVTAAGKEDLAKRANLSGNLGTKRTMNLLTKLK